jgi:cobalt/nickel transport system ATP-binding protein
MAHMIEIRDLGFSYPEGGRVFEGLSFSLEKGQRVGLIGPNGSGKSTLFHLIMGLLRPGPGRIKVFGRPREKEADFLEVRQRIGLLFQDPEDQLFCPTVEEDIAFGPLNLGKSHAEAREIVRECMNELGIGPLKGQVTHRLSGGEKRMVALASVIAMRPECLLLDEPNSGLDERHAERLLAYLGENAETCIVASHDIGFLRSVTDRLHTLPTDTSDSRPGR